MVMDAVRLRGRRPAPAATAVLGWLVGVVGVVGGAAVLVATRPSWLIVGGLVAAIGIVLLVLLVPAAVVPTAWVLVVFIGVLRKILAGSAGHVSNDPLIAAPYALLLPLLVARFWWGTRYRLHLWLAAAFAAVVFGAFLIVLVQGTSSFGALRATVEQIAAPLCALALVHPKLRGSLRATVVTVRITAVLAALYGIVQYVAPPRWDMRWLENVVLEQGVQSFGQPIPGQFRLFGPLNAPLAFAVVLSVGIICWVFWSGRLWIKLAAIAVIAVPLLLTSVRTSVFALALTLPIAALVHYRKRAVVPLVAIIAAVAAIPTVLSVLAPDLVTRFSVATLGTDTSLNSRVRLLDTSTGSIFGFGGGPGASSNGSIVTDNGYLAAFIDFGTLGGTLFLCLVLVALGVALRFALRSDTAVRGLPLALVLLYALEETSAPVIQSQQGLIFWVTLALLGVAALPGHPDGSAGADGSDGATVERGSAQRSLPAATPAAPPAAALDR